MGFDYIGFEIDEDYYQKAMERIKEHTAQLSLNDIVNEHTIKPVMQLGMF